jgi:hypothetical protein
MTTEPVRFACLLPSWALGDPPVIEAILSSYVRAAAQRGEVELAEGWRLADVRTEVQPSRFGGASVIWAIGTALGTRKPSAPASDI